MTKLASPVLRVGAGRIRLHVVAVFLLFEKLVQVLLTGLLVLLSLESVGVTLVHLLSSAANSSSLSSRGTGYSADSFRSWLKAFGSSFHRTRASFRSSDIFYLPVVLDDLLVDTRVLMRILFLLQTDRSFGEITHLRVLRRIGLRHHLDLQLALISLLVTWDSGGVNRTLEKRFVAASLPGIPSFLHLVDQHRLGVLLLVGVCVMLVRIVLSLNLVNLMVRDIFLVDALLIGALVSV